MYLNVYTPSIPDRNKHEQELYPVMIWFHGGGYLAGAGDSESYGPTFLLDKEVILVAVNYRYFYTLRKIYFYSLQNKEQSVC